MPQIDLFSLWLNHPGWAAFKTNWIMWLQVPGWAPELSWLQILDYFLSQEWPLLTKLCHILFSILLAGWQSRNFLPCSFINNFCLDTFYPGAVDPMHFINTSIYAEVQRNQAQNKNYWFEQFTVTCAAHGRGQWAWGRFEKILTPLMKYLQVYEQGKNSSSLFHAVEIKLLWTSFNSF